MRVGERAARVAEQLAALDEVLGERPAVLGHEPRGSPRAVLVDQAREQLLAGAGLTEQEHGGVTIENAPRQLDGGAQTRLRPDDLLERQRPLARGRRFALHGVARQLELVLEACVFARELVTFCGAPDDHQDLGGIPRFWNEVIDPAGVDRFHEAVDVGVGGEHDADRVRGHLLAPPQELDSGHAGHPVVREDHRHLLALEDAERFLAVIRADHRELGGQDGLERVEHARLVVHDQDRRSFHVGSSPRLGRGGSNGTGSASR